jgi:hypothetical protein
MDGEWLPLGTPGSADGWGLLPKAPDWGLHESPEYLAFLDDQATTCLYLPGWFAGDPHQFLDYVTNAAFEIATMPRRAQLDSFVSYLLPDGDESGRGRVVWGASLSARPQRRAAFGLMNALAPELQDAEEKAAMTRFDLVDDDPDADDVHESSRE